MDAVATAAALLARQLSPVDLLQETLDAITDLDPALNAYTVVDVVGAREQARTAERRIAAGDRAPLLGIPVSVKDAIWVAGLPATNGSRA